MAKKRNRKRNVTKSETDAGGWQPSYWMIVYDSDISLGKYQQINQIRFLYLLDTPSSIFYTSFS